MAVRPDHRGDSGANTVTSTGTNNRTSEAAASKRFVVYAPANLRILPLTSIKSDYKYNTGNSRCGA